MSQMQQHESSVPANKQVTAGTLAKNTVNNMGAVIDDILTSTSNKSRGAFIAELALTLQATPALTTCDPSSLRIAICRAAASGLALGSECWMVPRGGKANFQLGYKGDVAMAWRSGQVKDIGAGYFHENDIIIDDDPVMGVFKFKPNREDRGAVVGFWAHVETTGGGKRTYYCDASEAAAYSERWGSDNSGSAWGQFAKEMILRRPIKEVLKLIPKSKEQMQAMAAEAGSISSIFERAQIQQGPEQFGMQDADVLEAGHPESIEEMKHHEAPSQSGKAEG